MMSNTMMAVIYLKRVNLKKKVSSRLAEIAEIHLLPNGIFTKGIHIMFLSYIIQTRTSVYSHAIWKFWFP